jgi:hypothetical protein
MKTRNKFEVLGVIYKGSFAKEVSFLVRSNTSVNRVIQILCLIVDANVADIIKVEVMSGHTHATSIHQIFDANIKTTFRELAVVGKRSLSVVVELKNKT